VVNPAFVIMGWGERPVRLLLYGKEAKPAKGFRFGFNHTLESTDLVVWVRKETTNTLGLAIQAV
jgi:hypothetical protein